MLMPYTEDLWFQNKNLGFKKAMPALYVMISGTIMEVPSAPKPYYFTIP
jgi:hypothetical protein